jgi:hypothetical protein
MASLDPTTSVSSSPCCGMPAAAAGRHVLPQKTPRVLVMTDGFVRRLIPEHQIEFVHAGRHARKHRKCIDQGFEAGSVPAMPMHIALLEHQSSTLTQAPATRSLAGT